MLYWGSSILIYAVAMFSVMWGRLYFVTVIAAMIPVVFGLTYLESQAMKRRRAKKEAARDAYHRLTGESMPR